MAEAQATCSIDGCDQSARARQRCRAHYAAWYRNQRPELVAAYNESRQAKDRPTCQHAGCTNKLSRKNQTGYCLDHRSWLPKAKTCIQCGNTFLTVVHERKACDHCLACVDCGIIVKHARWGTERRCPSCLAEHKARVREARQREREAIAVRQTQPAFVLGKALVAIRKRLIKAAPYFRRECDECGTAFFTNQPSQQFCCERHGRRHRDREIKDKRRSQIKKNGLPKVYRARVAKRDGWRCGICHKRIDPQLKHPHPGALSIDHIVPLAAGGTHEPANVQATHLICNASQRHRGENQLLIFG